MDLGFRPVDLGRRDLGPRDLAPVDLGPPDVGLPPDFGFPPEVGVPDIPFMPDLGFDAGFTGPVRVEPNIIDFGVIQAGSAEGRILSLANAGPSRTVQGRLVPATGSNFSVSPSTPFVLESGAGAGLAVEFRPPRTVDGAAATVVVESCGGTCPVFVPVLARAIDQGVVCPSPVDLGTVPSGRCSRRQFSCSAQVDQNPSYVRTSSPDPIARSFPTTPIPIPRSGGSIAFDICPTSNGRFNVAVTPTFQFYGGFELPVDVAITGLAQEGVPTTCSIQSAASVNFPSVTVGASTTLSTLLTNVGAAACNVGVMGISGSGAGDFSTTFPGAMIAPGASVSLFVAFSPQAAGGRTAQLVFTSNDPTQPTFSVALSGTGIAGSNPTRFNIVADGVRAPTTPTGRALTFSDQDDGFAREPIPFPFQFLGTTVTDVFVSTNGFISFSQNSIGASLNRAIPAANNPNQLIAWFWDDLELDLVSSSVRVSVQGTAPTRRMFLVYTDIRKFRGGGVMGADTRLAATIELAETSNEIVVHYGSAQSQVATSDFDASVGWENAAGSAGGSFTTCSPNCTAAFWPTNQRYRYVPQ